VRLSPMACAYGATGERGAPLEQRLSPFVPHVVLLRLTEGMASPSTYLNPLALTQIFLDLNGAKQSGWHGGMELRESRIELLRHGGCLPEQGQSSFSEQEVR